MLRNNLICLLLFIVWEGVTPQSERYYYFYTSEQLEVNRRENRHDHCRSLCVQERDSSFILSDIEEFYPGGVYPSLYRVLAQGRAKITSSRVYCYDDSTRHVYRFRRVGSRALEAIHSMPFLKRGQRIYLHYEHSPKMEYFAFYNPLDLIQSDYWKSGVREGVFLRHTFPLDKESLYFYKRNQLVDSVSYSFSDPAALFIRNKFLKQYYIPPKKNTPSVESEVTPVRRKVIIRTPALRRQIG